MSPFVAGKVDISLESSIGHLQQLLSGSSGWSEEVAVFLCHSSLHSLLCQVTSSLPPFLLHSPSLLFEPNRTGTHNSVPVQVSIEFSGDHLCPVFMSCPLPVPADGLLPANQSQLTRSFNKRRLQNSGRLQSRTYSQRYKKVTYGTVLELW